MKNAKISLILHLVPIMLAFFAMGFVDLVGIASNYVKDDFQLSDTLANLFPSMVFFWFLIFAIPTGMLMNKIGRRKTVIISLWVTLAALLLPMIDNNFWIMLTAFSLLGIGNAIMQTSLNPLMSNLISGHLLSSMLTFGQFVKAIASFSAPLIAAYCALHYGNWRLLFPIFAIEGVIALAALSFTDIKEEEITGTVSGFKKCLVLLKNPFVLCCFIGIICTVGIDVGTNVSAPKLLMEKFSLPLSQAAFATSVYFLLRTLGTLVGTFTLSQISPRKFLGACAGLMLPAAIGLMVLGSKTALYICIGIFGFANANVFPIIFSQALLYMPKHKNEISGLMIMGLFGGTLFPLAMGIFSDILSSQNGGVAVIMIGIIYLLFLVFQIKNTNTGGAQ